MVPVTNRAAMWSLPIVIYRAGGTRIKEMEDVAILGAFLSSSLSLSLSLSFSLM